MISQGVVSDIENQNHCCTQKQQSKNNLWRLKDHHSTLEKSQKNRPVMNKAFLELNRNKISVKSWKEKILDEESLGWIGSNEEQSLSYQKFL